MQYSFCKWNCYIIFYINRLSCLALCFDLIKRCAVLYESLPSFYEIMHPIRVLLTQRVSVSEYPEQMQVCVPPVWNNWYGCLVNKFCDLHLFCSWKKKKKKGRIICEMFQGSGICYEWSSDIIVVFLWRKQGRMENV